MTTTPATNVGPDPRRMRLRPSAPARLARLPLPVLIGAGTALVVLAPAGVLLGQRGPTPGPVGMTAALAVSFGPLAVFVLRRLPGHPLGRLMLLTGATAAMATLAVCWSAFLPAAWTSQWMWLPPLTAIPLTLLLFPNGHLPSPRWRPLAVLLVAAAGVATLSLAVAALTAPRTLLTTVDQPVPPAGRLLVQVTLGCVALILLATVAVLVALLTRWRRAATPQRRQLVCLLPSAVLLVVGLGLDYVNVPGGWMAAVIALPVGLTLAIVQYRIYDLDLYVYRGVVWLVLTGLAVAVYTITVTAMGRLLAPGNSWAVTIVSVGAVAAALMPAERFAQRAVSRLLYGRRDDPYSVLVRLGRLTEAVTDPLAVLPRFTATLVDTLRVPYAAIVLIPTDNSSPRIVEHGRRTGEPQRFAMTAHGHDVGELLIAPRRPGAVFSAAETRLLRELAGQAAVAGEAYRRTVDLQRARERLVLAREEERRRLRRDMHDGVASALLGARMMATAASQSVPLEGRAPGLLQALTTNLDTCAEEVRTLIDGLRPAALDDGLETALHALTRRLPESALSVSVRVDGNITDLPAAIEVATYRIVAEALTNVVKHAGADRCTVLLARRNGYLHVSVADDGTHLTGAPGPAASEQPGVGISSIRSRAEELGGRLDIEAASTGTTVHAALPAHTPDPQTPPRPGQPTTGSPRGPGAAERLAPVSGPTHEARGRPHACPGEPC